MAPLEKSHINNNPLIIVKPVKSVKPVKTSNAKHKPHKYSLMSQVIN